MANTVNDVMNVIASPDYGIKNIAGTNQEILAIIQGTHNSNNNIYNIVDDIKYLLQTIVDIKTESKSVEISEHIYEKTNYINIKDILDETKGIRKSIDNLANVLLKQSKKDIFAPIAKLSDKASNKVAESMIKSMSKEKNGGGMSLLIDAFRKLKDIKLKDIFFGNQKIELISNIFKKANKELDIKEKDLNAIIKLVNAAPEIIKSLNKIGWRVNRIIKDDIIKKISDIFIGKESLLTISKGLKKNEKFFNTSNGVIKNIEELSSLLKKSMKKIFFASLWAKMAKIGIDSIETSFNKLNELSKNLNKNKKNIEIGAKVAKKTTTLVGSLFLTSLVLSPLAVTGGPALLGSMFLSKIVDKLTKVSIKLSKNKKYINKIMDPAIMLVAFAGQMVVTSTLLAVIAVTGGPALLGSMFLSKIVDKLTKVSIKLSKNKKYINKIMSPAIMLTAFTGIMVVTSALLAVIAVTGGPALLGSMFLSKIVDNIIRVSKKLSRSSIHIRKSILPAIMLTAFTGIMVVSTALLAVIAVTGGPALLGSVLLLGIIGINVLAFKILKKALKNILIGSLSMVIMCGSLILFGKALGKIAESTKDISWKQFGMIAALTGLFGVVIAILGIPAVAPFILLGAVAMAAMGGSLIVFGIALGKVSENTKDISWKQFGMIAALTGLFAVSYALMGVLSPLILLGSLAVLPMGASLIVFSIGIGKMVKETKDLTFMNAIIVAGSIAVIGLATAFVGIISPLVILGSLALLASAIPLAVFSSTLYEISSSTEDVKFMNILCFAGSMAVLALVTAAAGLFSFLIVPGAKTIDLMATSLSKCVKPIVDISNAGKDINEDNIEKFVDALSTLSWAIGKKGLGSWFIEGGAEGIDVMINTLSKFTDVIKKINEMKDIQKSKIDDICNSMESISSFFGKSSLDRKAKKKSNIYFDVLNKFKKIIKIFNTIKDTGELPTESYIDNLINITKKIFSFYNDKEINSKSKVKRINKVIKSFGQTVKDLKQNVGNFSEVDSKGIESSLSSMRSILNFLRNDTLDKLERNKAKKNIKLLDDMSHTMSGVAKIDSEGISSVGNALSTTLGEVNSIDISQVQAVTNMFNAFNGINKSENILNKFTKSVNEFTEACKNLMEAMGLNTDAINNMESNSDTDSVKNPFNGGGNGGNINSVIEKTTADDGSETRGIRISNVDEIARNIANQINGVLSIDIPDTQIQLLINGSGGNEWIITRY